MRILVIDDHRLVAMALRDVLAGEGHQVVVALGGEEGVEAITSAHRAGNPFQLVVTDYSMAHVDGLAVAAAVKQTTASAGVILITAYPLAADDPPPRHVDLLLTKPPKLRDLRLAIARLAPRA